MPSAGIVADLVIEDQARSLVEAQARVDSLAVDVEDYRRLAQAALDRLHVLTVKLVRIRELVDRQRETIRAAFGHTRDGRFG